MAQRKHPNPPAGQATDRAFDEFTELMISKIESIDRDWNKPWFTSGTVAWPRNLQGRQYNGSNAMMLMLHQEKEGYAMPFYGTFDAYARLNLHGNRDDSQQQVSVNRGARSFPVMLTTFTVVNRDTSEKIRYDDFRKLDAESRKQYNVYPKNMVYRVFNVGQTNLEQARPGMYAQLREKLESSRPTTIEDSMTAFPAMDEMVAKNLWYSRIVPEYGDQAYYNMRTDEITVPEKRQFRDGESFYGTLLHEMTHSTGADGRLNRFDERKGWGVTNDFYAREELVAEMGAAVLAARYGMDKHLKDDSASYLRSWLDSLHKDPQYIKTVMDDVRRATYMVGSRVDMVQARINAHRSVPGQEKSYPDDYHIDRGALPARSIHVEREEKGVDRQREERQETSRGLSR